MHRTSKTATVSLATLLFMGSCAFPSHAAGASKDVAAITADYKAGRNLPALEKCMAVLHKEPNNIDVHYLLGNIFLRLDKLENAYEEYNFCTVHGKGTRTATMAAQAMARMRELAAQAPDPDAPAQPPSQPTQNFPRPPRDIPTAVAPQTPQVNAPTGPMTAGDMQMAEKRASVSREGTAFIEAKRRTLEAQIKHLNDEAKLSIRDVPKQIYVGNHRVQNPDYDSTVQAIKDECATKVQAMQDDHDREERKITDFYKGLSNSYGSTGESSMYVKNFSGTQGRKP